MEENGNNNKKMYTIIICGLIIVIIALLVILFVKSNNNTIITINTDNACNNNIYDGKVKELTNLKSNDSYTISNNEATEAGEYQVTVKPNKGYAWEGNSKEEKTITCNINKADISLNIADSMTINKNNSSSITIDNNIEGDVTITADDSMIKVDNKEIHKDTNPVTIKFTSIKEGKTDIQITFTPSNKNYNPITKTITITSSSPNNQTTSTKVTPPTNSVCNKVIYNGKTQQLVSKTDYDGYTLKGQLEGTNVGNYTIEAVLKSGYLWSDGKSDNKKIICMIKQEEKKYSLNTDSGTCKAGQSVFLTVTNTNKTEDITDIYNSIKTINNNSSLTSIEQHSSCKDNASFKGPDNISVSNQASCIFPGQYEVKCLKPGNDTITFVTDNNETLTANITIEKGDVVKLGTEKMPYDGIYCVKGKEVTIRVTTYRDGVASKILKSYSVKNTNYATVSKSSTQPTCTGCTNLTIKCVAKGDTSLVITTNNGTSQNFSIFYQN